MNLTAHDHRLILTTTGGSYNFDALRTALEVQFPTHPPADRTPRQPGKGGKGQGRRVNVTEYEAGQESWQQEQ
eukprot:6279008-Amphidinium_carterae.1